MRTRIAQLARNAIQEIDRIAQIVRTNEPSFSSAKAERSSSSTSNETPSSSTSAVQVVTTQLGSQGRFCLPYPEFAMRETGRVSLIENEH